jgi:hypothetical protein
LLAGMEAELGKPVSARLFHGQGWGSRNDDIIYTAEVVLMQGPQDARASISIKTRRRLLSCASI